MMLSIIIPALNEAKSLPLLLESIRKQRIPEDYEIIVADAGSTDGTIAVARSYGCKVVSGGLPAKGRNEGAKVAVGDMLLFVDGDSLLPGDFIRQNMREFRERDLDVGGFRLYPYTRGKSFSLLYDLFYNLPTLAVEKSLPHATNTVLVKKSLHLKIGGFDEGLTIAEDHDYVRRIAKTGRFGILRASPLLVTTRRFDCDGWAKTYLKYMLCELHMIYSGRVNTDIIKFRFGHYEEKENHRPAAGKNSSRSRLESLGKAAAITFVVPASALVSLVCIVGLVSKSCRARLRRMASRRRSMTQESRVNRF